jgi:hypothetical protein
VLVSPIPSAKFARRGKKIRQFGNAFTEGNEENEDCELG